MSAISDFKAKMDAHNAKLDAAIDGVKGDIDGLKELITQLQNSQGTLSAEDQATLDAIEAKAGELADKVASVDDMTPPVPPAQP